MLVGGGIIIAMTWNENYGSTAESSGILASLGKAYTLIKSGEWEERRSVCLGMRTLEFYELTDLVLQMARWLCWGPCNLCLKAACTRLYSYGHRP